MKKSKKEMIAAIVGTVLILTPAVALKGTWFFVLTFGSIPAYHRFNNVDWKKKK